jgi:hypothetical protein
MDIDPIVVDIETSGIANAAEFLEPVQADKRLKDPEKIAADLAEKEAARLDKLALDWNVGRIVALAWWTEREGVSVRICQDEAQERAALVEFWRECRHRTIVGFNIKGFDLKFMVRRSQLLRVPYPILDFSKYSRKGITDLYLDLTFNDGTYDQGAMRRTLHAFCRRFGIVVTDTVSGAEIPKLVAAGEWDSVASHCIADVEATVELAMRLGVFTEREQIEAAI